MKKLSVLLLAVVLAGAARADDKAATPPVATKPAQHKADEVVARVGKTEIKWGEVDAAAQSFVRDFAARGRPFPEDQMDRLHYSVLDEMVIRELVLQQVAGHEPADLDAKVKEQVDQTKLQTGGDEGLTKALGDMGMTRDEYVKRVREGILIQETLKKLVDEKAKVSDEDAKKFYDENRSKFMLPEQVRASHILILVPRGASDDVKTQKLAQIKAALSLVKSGTPFADVAKKYSEDPGSAPDGGDLNFFPKGHMVPEFENAAFSLKTNEVSDIITTQYGYHIIKVTDRKPAGELAFAEAKPRIENYLKDQQGQEITKDYLKELRDKGQVEILLPKPPAEPVMPHSMGAPAGAGNGTPTVETQPVAAPK